MSASKALESLTAYYTDSENEDGDNRDETAMELELETSEEDVKDTALDDSENDGLPPEPTGKCAIDLQEKISKMYYKMQNEGFDLNKEIQSKKSFRNPGTYEKLVDYCELNEFGTNFDPHVFDPLKWGKESFYDELARVQNIQMNKQKKMPKTKVQIVFGSAKKVTGSNGWNNGPKRKK